MNVGLVIGSVVGGLALYSGLVGNGTNPLLAIAITFAGIAFVLYAFYKLHSKGKEK